MPLTPLSDLFPGYPLSDPQSGGELFQAEDHSALSDAAKALRAHLVDAVHGAERKPVTSPVAAKALLERNHLHSLYRKWVTYALDGSRHRILVPHSGGGMTWSKRVTKKVPHPDALERSLPVPDDGRYLVIWRGPVSILSVKDRVGGGVAEDLAYLAAHAPVADVLIWDCPPGEPTTLYSLLAGAGDRAGQRVEFPDPQALATAVASEPAAAAAGGMP